MKNYYIVILLLISVFVVSCTDSVEKYDNWPEWKHKTRSQWPEKK